MSAIADTPPQAPKLGTTAMPILLALSLCHMLNDTMQSMIPAIYPMIKDSLGLDFGQIGLITLAFNLTASLLQPLVGLYTDKRPMPYSLTVGMGFTLIGLVMLSLAGSFAAVVTAAAMVGLGSSVFHPESSRMARLAAGTRLGFGQSLFQIGGNAGSAIGPLMAAFIILPRGQTSILWMSILALLGMGILAWVGNWYARMRRAPRSAKSGRTDPGISSRKVAITVATLVVLILSKYFYMASFNTLALPYAILLWTVTLSVPIGMILASAFPAIVVYAQELMPGKVGAISGLFFGFAFGMGGLGAALLGMLADVTSITYVYEVCAYLPALGLLALLLPSLDHRAPN